MNARLKIDMLEVTPPHSATDDSTRRWLSLAEPSQMHHRRTSGEIRSQG